MGLVSPPALPPIGRQPTAVMVELECAMAMAAPPNLHPLRVSERRGRQVRGARPQQWTMLRGATQDAPLQALRQPPLSALVAAT